MTTAETLRALARYNRWMNERLYAVCATLSDEERKRDLRAFFRSVHGTLNHLLLADRAWYGRFVGRPESFASLDQELHADFEELRAARRAMDERLEAWCAELTDEALAAPLVYRNQSGKEFSHPLGPAALHLFNHGTHHRGQVTTLLAQLGRDPGVTDFIAWYRETGGR